MITILCMKWSRQSVGHQLPAVCNYTANHVNIWARMVERNVTVPHRLLCITDEPRGIKIRTVPMWELSPHGGCYHRLRLFSADNREVVGDRFMWMDLDCVVTGNMDHIVSRETDFAIHRHPWSHVPQPYNGSMCLMNTGAREQVWDQFNDEVPDLMRRKNEAGELVGSDQAWIAHCLGPDEDTFGEEHGVYEALRLRHRQNVLPDNASVVFFSGRRDPSHEGSRTDWIREHYK